MLCILSPAKSLRESEASLVSVFKKKYPRSRKYLSQPRLIEETKIVAKACAALSNSELADVLKASSSLVKRAYDRYRAFEAQPEYVAAFMFDGVAFRKLNVIDFSDSQLMLLQRRLCILSAFYGVLRPLDAIKPYRLDLANRLSIHGYSDLYEFWNKKGLTNTLVKVAEDVGAKVIIDCSSDEYSKALDRTVLEEANLRLISCTFRKASDKKLTAVRAKQARGSLVRYVVMSNSETVSDLKNFAEEGLRYCSESSTESSLVFKEMQSQPKKRQKV